jgi:hypothetical protein
VVADAESSTLIPSTTTAIAPLQRLLPNLETH